jgi:hypothetical protein
LPGHLFKPASQQIEHARYIVFRDATRIEQEFDAGAEFWRAGVSANQIVERRLLAKL